MPLTDLTLAELIGTVLAFLLTLMVFSYLVGDNPLFRLAAHLFVGAAAGYAGAVAWSGIIWPRLLTPLLPGGGGFTNPVFVVPLLLALLMLLKVHARTARFGNVAMAFLVGVGAAVAIGGAVTGTLFPQTQAAFFSLVPPVTLPAEEVAEYSFDGLLVLLGTIATLVYFHFGGRSDPGNPPGRPWWVAPLAFVGQVFIAITFGAMYAGALATSVAILAERLQFLWGVVGQILAAGGF